VAAGQEGDRAGELTRQAQAPGQGGGSEPTVRGATGESRPGSSTTSRRGIPGRLSLLANHRAASDTSPAKVSRDTRQLQDAGGSDTSPHYADSMSPERRPPSVDDEFLTVAEVAAILKLNQQTIRNWV